MGVPIVPAPDTGKPTVITNADIAAIVGSVKASSSILGVTNSASYSLNSLVELVYVRTGNEVMGQALAKLEGALSATQSTLSALSTLQGLQNNISVNSQSTIPFVYSKGTQTVTYKTTTTGGVSTTKSIVVNSADSYMSAYNLVASAYYRPIDPFFSITMPGSPAIAINVTSSAQMDAAQLSAYNFFKGQLFNTKTIISGLISALTPLTPNLANGQADPTTLLAKLKIVFADLPTSSFSSVRAWVLDGYTSHNSTATANQGIFQQDITNAIVAGESLNNTQSASVRQYMFIFEQYYQSATSIISQLNQIMNDVARKVTSS